MVLVVDDHPQLRQTAVKLLEVLGHQALQAENAREAEDCVLRRGGEIQVALLDMNLNGYCGADLAERLERARPGLRVLMMSGYQPEDMGEPMLEGRPFLGKPFSASALEAALNRLVAAG